jgi:hypothetical protein
MATSPLTFVVAAIAALFGGADGHPPRTRAHATERVSINDNRVPAGTLRDGVLTLRLEVRDAEWHPDRESDPGVVVRAFA